MESLKLFNSVVDKLLYHRRSPGQFQVHLQQLLLQAMDRGSARLGRSLELRDALLSLGNAICALVPKKSHVIHSLHAAFTLLTGH